MAASSDDVRDQTVFQPRELIFQRQLLFFQPLQRQGVAARQGAEGDNGLVELTVLAAQHLQLDAQDLIITQLSGGIHLGGLLQMGPAIPDLPQYSDSRRLAKAPCPYAYRKAGQDSAKGRGPAARPRGATAPCPCG